MLKYLHFSNNSGNGESIDMRWKLSKANVVIILSMS